MRARYEPFGGIIALDSPAATVYVDQAYMQELGYTHSPLWWTLESHLSAPITAHFAVTHRCPMNCQTCYNAADASSCDELSTIEAKRALDVLARMRVFTIAFGGGEPLARSDIFELAHYVRQCGITPTMTTNGFYVDRETARRCRAFSHVNVSLDGVGETYQAVRGVDGFEHAARAIKLLRENQVSVGVNCIVCRTNFDYLEELARFLKNCGVRDVIFLRLKPGGRARSLYETLRLTPEQRLTLYPLLKNLTRRYNLRTHVDCAMMPFIYSHHPAPEEALQLLAAEGCVGGSEIAEISPTGQVRACSFSAETAGSVVDLATTWSKAPALTKFRRWTKSAPEPCRSCEYLTLCRGGCHVIAEALAGDFGTPDPECPFVSAWGK